MSATDPEQGDHMGHKQGDHMDNKQGDHMGHKQGDHMGHKQGDQMGLDVNLPMSFKSRSASCRRSVETENQMCLRRPREKLSRMTDEI